MNGELMVTMHL